MAAGRPCGRAGAREERGPRAAGVRSLFVAAAGETTSVPGEKKLLRPDGPGGAELPGEEGEGQNVWSSILSEVSTRSRSKLPSGKTILVLGDNGSGKTTLMAKLQGAEHGQKGRGLEYLYLNVHDEDRDDHTRCNVWILDGDIYSKGLLKFAVSAESLQHTIVIFVVDMSRPWTVMESLEKWAGVLREHIDKLKIPPEEMRGMQQKIIKEFQEYVEPEEAYQGSSQRRGPSSGQENASVSLSLGENVLTHNLGIPVLVVCTKCDTVSVLEKKRGYREEHFDFIQSHIRRFCLQYGAALIYTSVKGEKNLDLLYKYLVHKMYGFQLTTPALVVEKDAVFIPAGWDNEKKIAILHENFTRVKPGYAYEDFIAKPRVRKLVHTELVTAEADQEFLKRMQSLLAKLPEMPTSQSESRAGGGGPAGSPGTQGGANPANVASASPVTSVKKPDPNTKSMN
ncbi:cytoplasmic dynein 1 light intermediate chain 2-like isoform X3 [Gallus gallus]|uniref:cytoplasmic dynein 1 light intermediate chain 2-like isoform X3 n=1 Tax=Gallus gallus TaxID=9031 RepID=UPI001AE3DEAA|nr:cytoplasmic dynein 1 light intermediate chain 2-like isoform X3 [Gallus gallus]